MKAFLYGVFLQWKLDLRSRTLLIACYIVPLAFFVVMGGVFTSILPDARQTLVQSMTIFGATMGALIGLPPTLVEIYGGDICKVYRVNGVPSWLGLVLCNLSAFIHLLIMSAVLYVAAPAIFNAALPANLWRHFGALAVFLCFRSWHFCLRSCFQASCFPPHCCRTRCAPWESSFPPHGDMRC